MSDPRALRGRALHLGTVAPWAFAALAGLMQFLASPAQDWGLLALCCIVPLHWAFHDAGPGGAFLRGWFSGSVAMGFGCAWLLQVLQNFTGSLCVSIPLFVLAVLSQGGRWGLIGLSTYMLNRNGFRPSLSLALSYLVLEFWYPMLFPWYLGVCAHEHPALLQGASLGGPWAVSAVFLAANVFLIETIETMRSSSTKVAFAVGLTCLGLLLLVIVWGEWRCRDQQFQASLAQPLRVGFVQANDTSHGRDRRVLEQSLHLTKRVVSQGAQLVVWSETSVPGGVPEVRAPQILRRHIARHVDVPLLFGAAIRRPDGSLVNSAFFSNISGEICLTCRYDKQILFPLGEHVPRFASTWFPRTSGYEVGDRVSTIRALDRPVLVSLCFEDLFPLWINRSTPKVPQLLVSLVDDQWFARTEAPTFHFAMSKLRAVEQGRFLVRGTNSGISGVIAPWGEVLLELPSDRQLSALGDVAWLQQRTLFRQVGPILWWLLTILLGGGLSRPFWDPYHRKRFKPPAASSAQGKEVQHER